MPRRPQPYCAWPGCTTRVATGRCTQHRGQARRDTDARRATPAARGYDRKWRRNRARFLAAHPTCRDCGAPATEPHHVPDRRTLVARGEPHPDAWKWLVPLCQPCHSKRTGQRRSWKD